VRTSDEALRPRLRPAPRTPRAHPCGLTLERRRSRSHAGCFVFPPEARASPPVAARRLRRAAASHGVDVSSRGLRCSARSARSGSGLSPLALALAGPGFGVFRVESPVPSVSWRRILSWSSTPLRSTAGVRLPTGLPTGHCPPTCADGSGYASPGIPRPYGVRAPGAPFCRDRARAGHGRRGMPLPRRCRPRAFSAPRRFQPRRRT
jgi:hypothetical protein